MQVPDSYKSQVLESYTLISQQLQVTSVLLHFLMKESYQNILNNQASCSISQSLHGLIYN